MTHKRKISVPSPAWYAVNHQCLGFSYFVASRLVMQPVAAPLSCLFDATELATIGEYQVKGNQLFRSGRMPIALPNLSSLTVQDVSSTDDLSRIRDTVMNFKYISILVFLPNTQSELTDKSKKGHALVIDTRTEPCHIYDTKSDALAFPVSRQGLQKKFAAFLTMLTKNQPHIGVVITTYPDLLDPKQ